MQRLPAIQQWLLHHQVPALCVEDPLSLLYLLGIHLSTGTLAITPLQAALFVDGRYTEIATETSLLPVHPLSTESVGRWFLEQSCHEVAVQQERMTIERFLALRSAWAPLPLSLLPTADPVMQLRLKKDPHELALLRRAARLTVEGIEYAASLLEHGVTEASVAVEMEIYWRRRGGDQLAFEPIIAFGSHSSRPHHRASHRALAPGEAVLIDAGVVVEGYHGDCTRFFPRPDSPPQLHKAAAAVAEAQQAAIRLCRPGSSLADLDEAARATLARHGLETYFTHSLGHGIGLEIHEPPRVRAGAPDGEQLLEEGMVLTIEPGVYLPGIGGVRLEEMVAITSAGHEILTTSSACGSVPS